jgi:hypothetical protein
MSYGVTFGPEKVKSTPQRFNELCGKLLAACSGYALGDTTGALATTLMTIITGAARDREEADRVLGRVVEAMRGQIRDTARPQEH